MIYFLGAQRHAGDLQDFLATYGRELADRITFVPYERILSGVEVRLYAGTYVFTSLGRDLGGRNPPSRARQEAARLHRLLVERFGPARVLNDPLSSLRRYDLLQRLHERGINRFAAHRVQGLDAPPRYPVFLRLERGTTRDAPPMLANSAEYRAALARTEDLEGVLAVEFCDTTDATGIYRKYSCFVVGERIVPRHLWFSRRWWVKNADLWEPGMLEEELAYMEANPHAQALREVFRLANISYGRADYALLDGQPQVWEINITPAIFGGARAWRPAQLKFAASFVQALAAIDPPAA